MTLQGSCDRSYRYPVRIVGNRVLQSGADPSYRLYGAVSTALLHHVGVDLLGMAFFALKRDAAPGVDGLTWRTYEADLDRNLTDLHERVHRGAYRALPSRRTYIPKADGKQRPLAVATVASNCTSIPSAFGFS